MATNAGRIAIGVLLASALAFPVVLNANTDDARLYEAVGDYESAAANWRASRDPEILVLGAHAMNAEARCLLLLGRREEAVQLLEDSYRAWPSPLTIVLLDYVKENFK